MPICKCEPLCPPRPLLFGTNYVSHCLHEAVTRRLTVLHLLHPSLFTYNSLSQNMAASSAFTSSLNEVKTLTHVIRSKQPSSASTITMTLLPNRAPISEGDIHQYLDSAICILGKASNQSYLDRDIIDHRVDQLQDKVDRGFNKADKHFTYVHKRFDKVEDSIKAVEKDVKSLKQEVKAVKEDVKSLRTDMNEKFKGIDCQFQENLAFQRNRLARVLDAEIEQVSSFVKCGDGEMRAEVAIDFPTTIWQFWLLKTRSKDTLSTPFPFTP